MASGAFRFADVESFAIDGAAAKAPSSVPALPTASDWQTPAASFERRMFTDGLKPMPDGELIGFWGFKDPHDATAAKTLPSPAIRVRERLPVHIKLDGAGGRQFIYQWEPKDAGTWLYQCHESTLKQFEMGLFGLLIVEPEPDEVTGKPRAYSGGPTYDVERCWVFDDVDPAWRAAGIADKAATFSPKYFLVNGVPNVEAPDSEDVAITAKAGDRILIRLLNASFSLVSTRIERLRGNIISVDGKALATPGRPWGKWNPVNPGQRVYMATGARHDLLIDLDPESNSVKAGDEFLVTFEFLDFAKRQIRNAGAANPLYVGRAVTRIRIV